MSRDTHRLVLIEARKGKTKTETSVTQVELIEYNLMKLERSRLFKEMRRLRADILRRIARGATVEAGPHSLEILQKNSFIIHGLLPIAAAFRVALALSRMTPIHHILRHLA